MYLYIYLVTKDLLYKGLKDLILNEGDISLCRIIF